MWSRQYLQQQNQIAAKNMNPYVAAFLYIESEQTEALLQCFRSDPFPTDGYVPRRPVVCSPSDMLIIKLVLQCVRIRTKLPVRTYAASDRPC